MRILILALGIFALLAGPVAGPVSTQAWAFDPRCPKATPARAKALAERAAKYLSAKGAPAALPRFMDRAGGFIDGDLYVFVFDLSGVLRASGGWPETVGSVVVPDGDTRTGGIYTRIRHLALTRGKGWVHYSWYNPCTRSMQPKMSYIIRVGGFIVGVGAYKIPGV